MKTKKIELLVALYGVLLYLIPVLIIVVSVVLGFFLSISTVWTVLLLIGVVVILYAELQLPKFLKEVIFQELLKGYQFFLTMQIEKKKNWKYFPSKNDLSLWNANYLKHLDGLSERIWVTNFHSNHKNTGKWKEALKNVYVPIYSIYGYTEKGVSLYDIETFDSFGLFPESTKELTLDQRKSLLFLKHLPLKDLQSCIERSLCLCFNEIVLGLLVLREGEGEKFEDFLEMVYSKKLHLCLTDDAISFLMKYAESIGLRERRDFSVAKPLMRKILLFLSYYVSIKEDTIKEEKRIAIFQWLIDQQAKCFASESDFFYIWPLFIPEELNILKANLNPLDYGALCIKKEIWKELSDAQLHQLLVYLNTPNNKIKDTAGFLKEVSNRWIL